MKFHITPGKKLTGSIRVPGDKSISHRSVILGSIAEGTTRVTGFLPGEDSLNTLTAFQKMGVEIDDTHALEGQLKIQGVGLHGLRAPKEDIDCGNSGTAMRLLMGLLAGQSFRSRLIGDASLTKRPMERVAVPLRKMGANIQTAEGGKPPVEVSGTEVQALQGIQMDLAVASAQVKSAIILAGLYAKGSINIVEPAPTRDHTERMLKAMGADIESKNLSITLRPGKKLHGTDIDIPADISSAAFFMVAATLAPDSDILLQHVGVNPTRIGIINILQKMGGNIEILNQREVGGEPVADIRVRSASLNGIDIPEEWVPLAIDEFPILFIAATYAKGITRIRGAAELRVKESDRIAVMADGLIALGGNVQVFEDGADITGTDLKGGTVDSRGDHRIAMSFAIAGHLAKSAITIKDCANVATSFPNFSQLAQSIGIQIRVQ
ncbi:MAG: 3-phosphoshikimate 1-carboxyvinyltransferase [Pseudomonadota bacterium]